MNERESSSPLPANDRSTNRPASRIGVLGFRTGIASGAAVGLIVVLILWAKPSRRETDDRPEIQDKLEKIGLAFQLHHDSFGYFAQPRAVNHTTELSWRVDLLPFLGHQQLYEQFALHEAWDSPHNSQLLPLMPDVFRIGDEAGHLTRMQVLTGPGSIFESGTLPRYALLTDGTNSTILIVECGYDKAVPWTKPEDLLFDAAHPLACLGRYNTPGLVLATVDGAVRHLKPSVPADLFLPLVSR